MYGPEKNATATLLQQCIKIGQLIVTNSNKSHNIITTHAPIMAKVEGKENSSNIIQHLR